MCSLNVCVVVCMCIVKKTKAESTKSLSIGNDLIFDFEFCSADEGLGLFLTSFV